jgi:Na+-translocating ferredoxin:NAD+ oxidoreductase RnfA subunit
LLLSLSIANVSNVIQIIVERDKPSYFIFFDLFWPLSNVIMLILGITVIAVKGLPGWKCYIPLATGLWFPLAMLSSLIDNRFLSYFFGGIYSSLAWALLALVIITTRKEHVVTKQ